MGIINLIFVKNVQIDLRVINMGVSRDNPIYLLSIFLSLSLFPLSMNISYIQNDEWIHCSLIENFKNGSFSLGSDIGSVLLTFVIHHLSVDHQPSVSWYFLF